MGVKDLKPVFDYLDDFKAEVSGRFDSLENQVHQLQTSVDGLAKWFENYRDEHIVLYRKAEILEEWAKKVAAKTGIPLPF